MMIVFLLWILVAFLGYLYAKRRYFTLRSTLPGENPYVGFGNLIETGILFHGVSICEALMNCQRRWGDIFQFWLGPSRFIIVGNIDDIQHIFAHRNIYDQGDVFVEKISVLFPGGLGCIKGNQFRRHISITSVMFRRMNIISNLDLITRCTDQLIEHWRYQKENMIHTDILDQSKNLLLDIFGFIAFDYDLEMLKKNKTKIDNELTCALQDLLSIYPIVIYSPRTVSSIYLKCSRRYHRARTIIRKYFKRMIDQELLETSESRAQRKRTSLIASLVASLQPDEQYSTVKYDEDRKGLTRDEILNEMLLFLVASFESTSSALAWLIHLMSKHPEVQTKIKAELDDQENLTVEQIDSMVYLDCVIKEVLRFCPPASGTARTLTTDDYLPNSGIQLYKGDSVYIPFHNLAHDPRYWSIDPEKFYPDRFLSEDRNHHPFALIPFGGGHRQCIAKDLAQFELKVIAARLMQQLTFGDGGAKINCGGYYSRITVMPKCVGVTVQFD